MAAERSDVQYSLLLISSHLRYYFLFSAYHQTFAFLSLSHFFILSLLCFLSTSVQVYQQTNKKQHSWMSLYFFLKYDFHFLLVEYENILVEIYVLKHLDVNLCISSWNSLPSSFVCWLHKTFFLLLLPFLAHFSLTCQRQEEDNCNSTIFFFFINSWVLKTIEN